MQGELAGCGTKVLSQALAQAGPEPSLDLCGKGPCTDADEQRYEEQAVVHEEWSEQRDELATEAWNQGCRAACSEAFAGEGPVPICGWDLSRVEPWAELTRDPETLDFNAQARAEFGQPWMFGLLNAGTSLELAEEQPSPQPRRAEIDRLLTQAKDSLELGPCVPEDAQEVTGRLLTRFDGRGRVFDAAPKSPTISGNCLAEEVRRALQLPPRAVAGLGSVWLDVRAVSTPNGLDFGAVMGEHDA